MFLLLTVVWLSGCTNVSSAGPSDSSSSYRGGHGIILPDMKPVETWEWERQTASVGMNDPVIFVEPEREFPYRMYVHAKGGQDLYKSKNAVQWIKIADDILPSGSGTNFNWGRIGPDGRYYLYRSVRDEFTELWIAEADDLTNLTNKGKVLDRPDAGGYYDPETGKWHMYYEGIEAKGSPCSLTIDHAVSDDGIHWEKKDLALDVREEDYKTGDPDIIKMGDTYIMFFDVTVPDHPAYKIGWATSKSLDEKFTIKEAPITNWMGGDACVRYIPELQRFVMYQEFFGDEKRVQGGVGWGWSQRFPATANGK